jgi:hypothetical protein
MAPLRALSIRQPYAEMILRGIKTIEYRSRPTRIIGERFFIYASKGKPPAAQTATGVWSRDLSMPKDQPPPAWMLELWELVRRGELPTGVIVGSARIEHVTQGSDNLYEWHLADVERAAEPRKPSLRPQPVWFRPF